MNIKYNVYMSIYRALKRGGASRWEEKLGYSINELRKHLEIQFKEDMNWDNYGKVWGIKWYIPHRYYSNIEIKNAWSLKNCYPEYLTKIKKNTKFNPEIVVEKSLIDILPIGKLPFKIRV